MFALVSALALLSAGHQGTTKPAGAKPVTLAHVFKLGQKMQYQVKSELQTDERNFMSQTFIPSELTLSYGFTTEITKVKPDGIAVMHYQRPTMTQVDGETADRGPLTHVEKIDLDAMLTVTPVNDIIDHQDLSKSKKPGTGGGLRQIRMNSAFNQGSLPSIIGPYIVEMQRLMLFVGNFESALDLSPRLPLDEVSVGDTWKRTVGYQPQKVKGTDGKQAVQRLDYTYTYEGMSTWNNKPAQRVTATLTLDTDLADFINQTYNVNSDVTGIKTIPLKLNAKVEYFLDPTTFHTIAANASTEGGFKIVLNQLAQAYTEQQLIGKTTLRLTGISTVPPKK